MKKPSINLILASRAMIIACSIFLVSCSKDETPPASFSDFEFSGIFNGSLYSMGSSSPIEGYVTIDASGATTLDLLSGRMKGTAMKTSTNYNITRPLQNKIDMLTPC